MAAASLRHSCRSCHKNSLRRQRPLHRNRHRYFRAISALSSAGVGSSHLLASDSELRFRGFGRLDEFGNGQLSVETIATALYEMGMLGSDLDEGMDLLGDVFNSRDEDVIDETQCQNLCHLFCSRKSIANPLTSSTIAWVKLVVVDHRNQSAVALAAGL